MCVTSGENFQSATHLSEDLVIWSRRIRGPSSTARVSWLVKGVIGHYSSPVEISWQDKIVVLHPFYDRQSLRFNLWRTFSKKVRNNVTYRTFCQVYYQVSFVRCLIIHCHTSQFRKHNNIFFLFCCFGVSFVKNCFIIVLSEMCFLKLCCIFWNYWVLMCFCVLHIMAIIILSSNFQVLHTRIISGLTSAFLQATGFSAHLLIWRKPNFSAQPNAHIFPVYRHINH